MAQDLYYRVSIKAGGAGYDLSHDLSSFTIEEAGAKPDMLTLQLSDPFKVFGHAFQEGMEVEVELGTVDDHSLVFRGRTYKVDADFPQEGVPTLKLQAYDYSMRMGLRRRNRSWPDTKLYDIVFDIADDYFRRKDIRLQGNPHFEGNGIRQHDKTDLEFLRELATEHGCEMYVDADESGDTFHFVSQYDIMNAKPEATLYYGRCGVPSRLISFEASGNVGDNHLPRLFSGIVYKTGKATEIAEVPILKTGEQEDRFFDENLAEFRKREPIKAVQLASLIEASPVAQQEVRQELGSVQREALPTPVTEKALREREKNQYSISVHGMRASGSTVGDHRLHAQASVTIADVGRRFSGTWYLSQVRHILNSEGYKTEFQCQR